MDNSDSKNRDRDKSTKVTKCRAENVHPNSKLDLEVGARVAQPNIKDVERRINETNSSKDDEGPSAQEIKSKLGDNIRTMKRSDLETLIVDKIIEEISTKSDIGVLNEKLRQANAHKDRLYFIIYNLQRQVTELSKAVRSAAKNVGTNQKTNQNIRFCRSVGVQVLLDGCTINPPPQSRSLSQPKFPKELTTVQPKQSALNSGNNNTPSSPVLQSQPQQVQTHCSPIKPVPDQVSLSSILNWNANPGLKRSLMKQTISVAEVGRLTTDTENKLRKVGSPASTASLTPPKISSANTANEVAINSTKSIMASSSPAIQQQQQQQQNNNLVMRNPAAVMAAKYLNLNGSGPTLQVQGAAATAVLIPKTVNGTIEPGIIDLTDDDGAVITSSNIPGGKVVPPATPSSPAAASLMMNGGTNANSVTTFQNDVQYRLVSQGPGHKYKLVKNGQNYHVVTSGDQNWPISVSAVGSAPQMGATMKPAAEENIALHRSFAPDSQVIVGEPIKVMAGGRTNIKPMITSAAVEQQAKNAVTPRMVKQQQSQLINSTFKVPTVPKQQKKQEATQVKANKVNTKDPVGPQTECPMGQRQAPKVNTRSVADVVKKFVLPPLPPPAIAGAPKRCSKDIPPRPDLTVTEQEGGIVLSWALKKFGPNHAEIQAYQIYACQEPLFTNPNKPRSWTRVGHVNALPLPMKCTLSKFGDGNRYHFIVRGVDAYNRTGPFCAAAVITLNKK